MFRASFRLAENPGDGRDWGRELRSASPAGVLIVAGFLDAKTVEAYLDFDPGTDVRAVTDILALRLGIDDYEVNPVEWLPIPATEGLSHPAEPELAARPCPATPNALARPLRAAAGPPVVADGRRLLRVHPGAVTQVLVQPDGRTLSIQVRHRRNQAVGPIVVQETAEVAEVRVSVGTPEDAPNADCVSFGITFSWVGTYLDRPLGGRRIVHTPTSSISRDVGRASSAVAREILQPATAANDEKPQPTPPSDRQYKRTPFVLASFPRPNIALKLVTLVTITASLLLMTMASAL